jgi:acetyl esterase/lipase
MVPYRWLSAILATLVAAVVAFASEERSENPAIAASIPPTFADLVYATVDDHPLTLDLYLPPDTEAPPLVVYIHGGGWETGSKEAGQMLAPLTRSGFALASINYRLTDRGPFPAQLHDCKAAIRWLRAQADDYGYRAEKFAVAGASAGGHLALLVGLTSGDTVLEGDVGDHDDESSAVSAVVNIFGPVDFTTILAQLDAIDATRDDDNAQLRKLLDGLPLEQPQRARQASPISHVDADDPPVLTLHGQDDHIVPIAQAEQLHRALRTAGVQSVFKRIPGAGHSRAAVLRPGTQRVLERFLRFHLKPTRPAATPPPSERVER